MLDSIRLSDLIAAPVDLHWVEAVAIGRDIAERLADDPDRGGVPEPEDIRLLSVGRMDVTPVRAEENPIKRLGQVVHAVGGQSDAPAKLRLTIAQAISPTPGFSSVGEFSDALAYFERPGRSAILQALFERAVVVIAASSPMKPTKLDEIAPLPRMEPARPHQTEKLRRGFRVAGVAAAVLALALLAAVAWRYGYTARGGAAVVHATARASSVIGSAVVSGISAASHRVGLGRLAAASPAGAATAEAPVAAVKVAESTSSQKAAAPGPTPAPMLRRASPPARAPVAPGRPQLMHAVRVIPLDLASAAPTVTPVSPDEAPLGPRARSPEGEPHGEIFTAASAGIQPPTPIRPQFARELPPGITADRLSQIAIVISAGGQVESVKLLGVAKNVHDWTLLSAAKTWQFAPATKDGRPVRFRRVITVATQ